MTKSHSRRIRAIAVGLFLGTLEPFQEARAAQGSAEPHRSLTIQVETQQILREVSPWLFGMHVEWVEDGLGLLEPDSGKPRRPVLDRLLALRPSILRFPGGIHADYYAWEKGVGPTHHRPPALNVFTGKDEPSRFGSEEFATLLREFGAQGLVTANYGTGTAVNAGAWASHFAAAGVHPPFWEVGNETYLTGPTAEGPNGKSIYKAPERYAADFAGYRDAIRTALPVAKVGIIAHLDTGAFALAPQENRDWTVRMLKALATPADFVAVHNAYAPVILDDGVDLETETGRRKAYQSLFAAPGQVRDNLDDIAATVSTLSPTNHALPIAITEFGPFFGLSTSPATQTAYVDQTRTLASALYVASLLDTFISDPRVFLACYTNPIHRWFGSLLTDTPGELVRTPSWWVYDFYRNRFENRLLQSEVRGSARFDAPRVGIIKERLAQSEIVAQAATNQAASKVTVVAVNRSLDHGYDTTVSLSGFAANWLDCQILTAPSPAAINGPSLSATTQSGGPEIRPSAIPCTGSSTVRLQIPPTSVVSIVAGV